MTTIERRDIKRGILLPDLDAVAAAILAFGGASADALHENQRQISEAHGGMGLAVALLGGLGGGDCGRFAERVARDAVARLERPDRLRYRGSWDYDGPGPFHKASLDVDAIGEGGAPPYELGVHAAYVGDQPEQRLADRLGVGRGLCRIEIKRGYIPDGNRFAIPLHELREVAVAAAGIPFDERDIATVLSAMIEDQLGVNGAQPLGITPNVGGARACLRADSLYFGRRQPREDRFGLRVEEREGIGPVLTGYASESYREGEAYSPAPVIVDITAARAVDRHDPAVQAAMRRLADRVEEAWSTSTAA